MPAHHAPHGLRSIAYCLLAALAMGYGWGYRGTVGHEYGAMVPGAILGLMLCLGSGRFDWHRRAAVVGLFAAAGWAWGGSLSYMEQTFYALSDSFPDVLFGYAVIFFLGALWAGCGGAVLGLALTERREYLDCLARCFFVVCFLFLLIAQLLTAFPDLRQQYLTLTVQYLHNGDWLSATLTLIAAALYWLAQPKDRPGASLFFWGAVAWWIGYGLLTFLGDLRLGPMHRSESWGGILGLLVVLIIHLLRRKNRVALLLCLYGIVGGGAAFVLGVFVHNVTHLKLGPIAELHLNIPAWRSAEVTFGFWMGLFLSFGTLRLLRSGLAPPVEEGNRAPLDVFAVFVMLIALPWINFRRHFARLAATTPSTEENQLLGLSMGGWFALLGLFLSLSILWLLWNYLKGNRGWAPRTAFGKGAALVMIIIWGTATAQLFDGAPTRVNILAHFVLWVPATLATCLLASFVPSAERAVLPQNNLRTAEDRHWRVGQGFAACAVLAIALIFGITGLSLYMQTESAGERGRLRFGPHAYWRQTEKLQGIWKVKTYVPSAKSPKEESSDFPFVKIEFDAGRNAATINDKRESQPLHRWGLKDQYIWLHWNAKAPAAETKAEIPLKFQAGELRIAWPPGENSTGYLVLERE